MDRAAFLRSLPYLRPLPPSLWAQIHTEPTSSCSTATPPTPGNEHDSVILEDVVVSIEPVCQSENRKRDRDGAGWQLAFYACEKSTRETDEEIGETSGNGKKSELLGNDKINNDPAMCSFEVSIVKRKHMISCLGHAKDPMTTPSKTDMEVDENEVDEPSSVQPNALLFRFGNYFLFEADPSAIMKVEHQAVEESEDNNAANCSPEQKDGDHQSKRQRTENGKVDASKYDENPASLCIEFPSCVFRVFNVDAKSESGDNSDLDASFINAKAMITKRFDVGGSTLTWGTCPFDTPVVEIWTTCLDPQHVKDRVSPNKSGSSSTHFENGQKSSSQIKPLMDVDQSGEDDGADGDLDNSETQPTDLIAKKSDDQQSSQKSQHGSVANSVHSRQGEDTLDENVIWSEISSKRRNFDSSWFQMHESVSSNGNASALTSCAHSLAGSYCNPKQQACYNENCDAEIEHATGDIQELIETIKSRGKADSSVSNPSRGSGEDLEQSVECLLRARKEAVAAKYALLLVPKR